MCWTTAGPGQVLPTKSEGTENEIKAKQQRFHPHDPSEAANPGKTSRLQTHMANKTRPPRSHLRHMEFFPQGRPQSIIYFHETFITFHSPHITVIFSKARGNGNKFLNNPLRDTVQACSHPAISSFPKFSPQNSSIQRLFPSSPAFI